MGYLAVMIRAAAFAALSVMLFHATPANAQVAQLVRADGSQLTIRCRDWGCSVLGRRADGAWALIEKGPGGAAAFEKLTEKYQALGFATR